MKREKCMFMIKTSNVLTVMLLIAIALSLAACGCKHEEVIDAAVPATCTKTGLSEGKHCALCDVVIVEQEEIAATGHIEEAIPAVEASCTTAGSTEGKKCLVCGEVLVAAKKIPALGHTTTTGTCTRCNTSFGIFTTGYYVDEFNQPTTDGFVVNETYIAGTFSNSATTDSLLYVKVLVDEEDITFFLYEYGYHTVKNYSSRYVDEYDITMKTADGKKHNITGTIYCGSDRIFVDSKYETTVLNALKSGEKVSFYIVQSDSPTNTYLFTVNTSNFAEEYKKLVG